MTSIPIRGASRRKVAGYARVSTDLEEQQTSYEAQVDYYTSFIKSHDDWEFVSVYTDEGISATSTKHREGFQQMVEDALAGKIDLIVTKSVSRFARNTVDSLTTIRKLKEHGTEVYFEKENIWTFEGRGELLLTIMSSLAQEESRSISENVRWGQRKKAADGKYSLNYSHFLGYDKGPDGKLVVNREQAEVVRKIFGGFLSGKSAFQIAKDLTLDKIPPASGEYYDIVFTCSWVNDFDKNAEAGLYYDITDLVQKETPALYQSIGKYWDCAKINGRIMGIPILKDMGAQNMFRLNADYLEGQKGMEIPEEMDGLEALEPFLKAYKEDYPDKYPIAMDRGGPPGYMNFVEQIAGGIIVIPYDQETEIPQAIFGDYSTELRTGTSDPDVVIPKMRARMEAAGFDELLADVQDQINEWFASDNLSQPDSDSDPPDSTYPSSS